MVVKKAGKITKCKVDLDKVCSEKVVAKVQAIVTDDTHPHDNYKMAVDKCKNDPLLEFICTPFNPPNESVVMNYMVYQQYQIMWYYA